jgi:hypothetical protein
LHVDEEDDEAHPPMPSERRGTQWSGDAMVRLVVAVGFLLFRFSHREEKRERMEGGRWRRCGRKKRVGFPGDLRRGREQVVWCGGGHATVRAPVAIEGERKKEKRPKRRGMGRIGLQGGEGKMDRRER